MKQRQPATCFDQHSLLTLRQSGPRPRDLIYTRTQNPFKLLFEPPYKLPKDL